MSPGIVEDVPLSLHRRVEEIKAGDRREGVFIDDVEPRRESDPLQLGVEEDQPQQPEPEDRHRIADQADEAHDLVDEAAAPHRREHAERHADDGADDGAQRGELDGRGENTADVGHHRIGGQHRGAEIAAEGVFDIDVELLDQRQVETHLAARALDDAGRGPVAEHGQHRVDRDDAANEEGHREKTEIGRHRDDQETAER